MIRIAVQSEPRQASVYESMPVVLLANECV